MVEHQPVTVIAAQAARDRITGMAIRSPLVRIEVDSDTEIYLKLENLQPIGSFKIRGAASKLMGVAANELKDGVWTASAGNMAQGAAYCARALGVDFTAVVPDTAPDAKIAPIERLGGHIVKVPRDEYFEIYVTREHKGQSGMFVHAFSDPDVMAGNATIGLELLEDLPDVKAVYIPYGGGGLTCGIASVVRELSPETEIIVCEPDTAAPVAASLAVGEPTPVQAKPSFVDGAGAPHVFTEMFPLVRTLVDRATPVSPDETAAAVRLMVERTHIVAEGAGALALAAALKEQHDGPVVCIVSGGNLNPAALAEIVSGRTPQA